MDRRIEKCPGVEDLTNTKTNNAPLENKAMTTAKVVLCVPYQIAASKVCRNLAETRMVSVEIHDR